MWIVNLGELVWADHPNGELHGFRYVGPFASHKDAEDFCRRYGPLRDARPYYVEAVAEFTKCTPRFS